MDSPRGRTALMRAAADERIGLDGAFQAHIDLCLGCRACETACPSGVQYGLLLETAKAAVAGARGEGRGATPGTARNGDSTPRPSQLATRISQTIQRFGLRELMPHRKRLRLLARGLWLYQRLGLARIAARVLPKLPPALTTMEGMAPPVDLGYLDESRPAPAIGPKRGKVAFFTGCVQDAFLAGVNRATVRVLQRNGYEVHFAPGQTCCNAAALHSGDTAQAHALARQNIDAFSGGDFVAIVNNAGGCGASLKGYDHLLADDPIYAERARAFVAKVQDISEFLADHLHKPPTGHVQARVEFEPHRRRPPMSLRRSIVGVDLDEDPRGGGHDLAGFVLEVKFAAAAEGRSAFGRLEGGEERRGRSSADLDGEESLGDRRDILRPLDFQRSQGLNAADELKLGVGRRRRGDVNPLGGTLHVVGATAPARDDSPARHERCYVLRDQDDFVRRQHARRFGERNAEAHPRRRLADRHRRCFDEVG